MLSTFQPDTDNQSFQDALSIVKDTNLSMFLTGRAGTGKSTFLRYVRKHVEKKFVVLAPTGIAAINVQGMTLHSFFKFPLRPIMPNDKGIKSFGKTSKTGKIIREADTFVIDEISMVRADMLDAVDTSLRINTGNHRQPFGGKQMLFIGDLFQLEPVIRTDTSEFDVLKQLYDSFFFFDALCLKRVQLINLELQKVYRQQEQGFIQLLDKVRSTDVLPSDLTQLNKRAFIQETESNGITLCSTNRTAQSINDQKLLALESEPQVLKGWAEGDFPERMYPTELNLELKEGAQVMFIRNDPEGQFVNGSIGELTELSEDTLTVTLDTGKEVDVVPVVWENIEFGLDEASKQIVQDVKGEFNQVPLKLAWAITIHKSQGLTFDHVKIDLGRGAFAGGQVYVALSRCTTFEGLILKNRIRQEDIFIHDRIKQFAHEFTDSREIKEKVKSGQKEMLANQVKQAMADENYDKALEVLNRLIANKWDGPYVQVALGKAYYETAQFEKSLSAYSTALVHLPHLVDALLGEGKALLALHQYAPAAQSLRKVIRQKIGHAECHFLLGKAESEQGNDEEATKQFEIAASSGSKDAKEILAKV